MKILDVRKKEFLDWTIEQDNNKHNNASDLQLEEIHGTPKHRHRPEEDWDRYNNFLPKGTRR